MDLVIDANILFSVLIRKGKTEELLFEDDLHLFAPEFIFEEFRKCQKPPVRDRWHEAKASFSFFIDLWFLSMLRNIPSADMPLWTLSTG